MVFKVAVVGQPAGLSGDGRVDSLLLRALGLVTQTSIESADRRDADLVIVHPYMFPFRSTPAGAALEAGTKRLLGKNAQGAETLLKKIYRIPVKAKILAVSHENLDRRPWQAFGNLLLQTDLPRLTFWPQELDPKGFRFPYWWNYVDWPQIPRLNQGGNTRFGAFYDLDALCDFQEIRDDDPRRLEKAVWLTNHLDFPRNAILSKIRERIEVDLVQGVAFGKKIELLQKYRYCISTENSTGYGYETEKILDARSAGCLSIGYVQNPCSDFVPEAFFFNPPMILPERLPPLLKTRPSLDELLNYLGRHVS